MDQNNALIAQLGIQLAEAAARNSAQLIVDRIKKAKTTHDKDKTIAELENIIDDLTNDKNELTQISQAYKAELAAQQITEKDITFIVDTVVPTLEKLLKNHKKSATEQAKDEENLESVKNLLSKEVITVLQVLGFNYKRAVGEPLTDLIGKLIKSYIPTDDNELKKLNLENSNLSVQLSMDAEAYERFLKLTGRS